MASTLDRAPSPPLTAWLSRRHVWILTFYGGLSAFLTYAAMYGLRKPFTVATFSGAPPLWDGVTLKTTLAVSQVLGYALAKFTGVKVCSEATPQRRTPTLILTGVAAQLCLLAYALLPPWGMVLALFLNGFSLGMIWGLLVGYLEGRRNTEAMLASMSFSYIVSSGMVKDLGLVVLKFSTFAGISTQRSESLMPFLVGCLVLPLFLLGIYLLHRMPPPDALDMELRSRRVPMSSHSRWTFIYRFLPGLILLVAVYFFLTAYRDYRDKFGVELFKALGYPNAAGLFTLSETPIGISVLLIMASINAIVNNWRALWVVFGLLTLGVALLGGSTLLLDAGRINGFQWMILTGLGAYLAYVPYGAVLFERIFAHTRFVGNASFGIMMADSLGYTGTVVVLLYSELGAVHGQAVGITDADRLFFFRQFTYALALGGIVLYSFAAAYFLTRPSPKLSTTPVVA